VPAYPWRSDLSCIASDGQGAASCWHHLKGETCDALLRSLEGEVLATSSGCRSSWRRPSSDATRDVKGKRWRTHLGLNPGASRTFWISTLLSFVKVYKRTNFRYRDGFHAFLGLPPGPTGAIEEERSDVLSICCQETWSKEMKESSSLTCKMEAESKIIIVALPRAKRGCRSIIRQRTRFQSSGRIPVFVR
jgi:hypothetical protein